MAAPARRARLQRPEQIWGRRAAGLGAVLVVIAVIGGIVLLVSGGDNGSESKQAQELQDRLDRTLVDVNRGITVRIPGDWKASKKLHVINVQSPGRCLVMTFSAPVPASKGKALRRDGVKFLKSEYKSAKVQAVPRAAIGGVPTTTNVITFRNRKGKQVRVLLSVGTGKKNAYLTQVLVGNPACGEDLAFAQAILNEVEYTK